MRTSWNGSLTFGLVSIPVGLASATRPTARQSDVTFRLLHRECATPIKQKRWCPTHDREVSQDEVVRGVEVAKGQYVVVEDAELEALERRDDSRSIEIRKFVPQASVDPTYFDRHYLLVPAAAAAQRRPYVLLLEAMRETGMAALGRFVRGGRESLCLVRARGDALALETLFLAEDVFSQAEIAEAVAETEVQEAELELARQVIEGLAGEFVPSELVSEYRRDLRALLEAKLRGEEIAEPEPVSEAPVVDLLEALKASVAAAKERSQRKKEPKTQRKAGVASRSRAQAS
ncbi:MAG: Ku protein [Thermoleophilia bacterium]|nr:Ku protein [Gaiellaceae bacterium]MDW8337560.1 Ku protein [Thermoleophilia bacterium]